MKIFVFVEFSYVKISLHCYTVCRLIVPNAIYYKFYKNQNVLNCFYLTLTGPSILRALVK